ncbi:spermatogenesis-associated protein 7-like [Ylistrum balloti]|uniref:spermatogenesis-associated protein 7-like n=1 Tax=Ylistrum balloti TaxID=509963 RepID=UPI002905B04D|nr:spermatogenesis-associated protein 7-like [Ylistrum balloti]
MGGRTGNAGMQAKSNMSSMKGQLGLRSSALAPTSAKLTTQYLVLDHMNNHYSKIVNAKSAIDNRPPKVLSTSQKARDRKTREYVKKTGVRPSSSMNIRPTSRNIYYDDMDGMDDHAALNDFDPEDDDDRLVLDIMKTTLKSNRQDKVESTEATYGGSQSYDAYNGQSEGQVQGHNYRSQGHSYQRPDPQGYQYQTYSHQQVNRSGYPKRPSSARSVRSATSGVSRSALPHGATHNRKVEDGDILATRKHVFTEPEKPFTPRTLKSTRTSKLSQTKFYTAPPQKRKDPTEEKHSDKHLEESVEKPKPKPRRAKSPMNRTETPLTETSLMYETLQSRDFSKFDKDKMVPTLDISMDKDHLNWIKEQASKAEIRAKSSKLKTSMERIKEKDLQDTTDMGETGELTTGTLGRTTRSFGTRTMGRSGRLNEQEEELQYVEFMKEVTDDVLNRGVFTNRVLKQVFQNHIEKRKGHLDEHKMRGVLDEIRRDLGIPHESDSDISSYTGSPDISSRLKSTGYTGRSNNSIGISKPFDRTFNSTMDSQNTYGLQSMSGDLFSTINSEFDREDMSNTQALQSYQLEMTRKEAIDEAIEEGVPEADEGNEKLDEGIEQDAEGTLQQPRGRLIQVGSRDTDQESVHSSSSKSRVSRSKKDVPPVESHQEVFDKASVHSQASRSWLSAASRSRPSSVVSAGEQVRDNISVHSHASRLKATSPQPRQNVDQYQDIVQSPKSRSLVSRGEETDDTLTHDHSQLLSEGETEGAYGEDEFEESEPDDQLGTATHRTSDDDF